MKLVKLQWEQEVKKAEGVSYTQNILKCKLMTVSISSFMQPDSSEAQMYTNIEYLFVFYSKTWRLVAQLLPQGLILFRLLTLLRANIVRNTNFHER